MRRRLRTALAATALCALAGPTAYAQDDAPEFEVPVLILDIGDADDEERSSDDLDLANVVTTAAKGITTVQEAPAIITVITGDQLEDRHARNIEQALDFVPGWMRYGSNHSQFPYTLSRGAIQGVLLLRDGVSMFDPMVNVASFNRSVPIEAVKRIETITGPAGVLWGANSFLGLVNVITKTGGDVEGVESAVGYGSGPGSPNDLRGYIMAGATDALIDDLELFGHVSFESFQSPSYRMPSFLYHSPQPQPNSLLLYGPLDEADPQRSTALTLNVNANYGRWTLDAQLPSIHENKALSFTGGLVNEDLPDDSLPECQSIPPGGAVDDPPCIDRDRAGRRNQFQFYERFASLKFSDRVGAHDGLGVQARGYGVQFVRRWTPLQILVPVATVLPGGLGFDTDITTFRVGSAVDLDYDVTAKTRVLFGVEGFREWLPDRTVRSIGGPGAEATFRGPYNLDLLPIACPQTAQWDEATEQLVNVELVEGCPLTFANQVDRTVFGSYAAAQWRPTQKLILDGGARIQAAPAAFSKRDYDPQLLGAAALVYNFAPRWHVKANYTQGFRPPVFNNTDLNGEAVSIPGSPDLEPERSQAYQAEINARIPTNRRVREFSFRADYSYTILENLISFPQGQYTNGGDRGIHSAEFLGQINISGGHRVELGYTWLRVRAEDLGDFAAMPEHWFTLGVVASLNRWIEFSTNARVVGAFQDPNRIVEYRDLSFGANGSISPDPTSGQSVVVQPYELVMDRIPPGAEINAGLRFLLMSGRMVVDASVYNAFDAVRYQPDATSSFSPRLDILPNPYERVAFFLSASYRPPAE